MEIRDLQKLLSQPYKEDNWKTIVLEVFPNVSLLDTPAEHPINGTDKEVIKRFRQLGTVRLADGKNLALFDVIVADNINLRVNRVKLNDIVSKYIDADQAHGVLSIFEQGGDDYRFTFSAKSQYFDEAEGDFVNKRTDTKRYTYVLGKNESCKTPAKRFHELSTHKDGADMNAIQKAFSVEKLSKEFFDKYKVQFEKFWQYLANTAKYKKFFTENDKEKQIRDFTKKLLGRIVFLHFLQKKGWMGCEQNATGWENGDKQFMPNLFDQFQDKNKFHSACLSQLFFDTLNNGERTNHLFICEGLEGDLNNSKIPYLNGGLFDSDVEISGQIDFPEAYFADLFEFFGQYNFTIDENDPHDHEVGIDPEMLGHIFENLLEDNKDKGAFYTPKVIVQYMCQESIIEYLCTKLNAESNETLRKAIELLVRTKLPGEVNDLDIIRPIAQALYDVKICDPAIGSGAFPMGILNEIYIIVQELWGLQPNAVAEVWDIDVQDWQPHLVKKNIIQHSIYGVDIESGAVDIARLRFWLALVVDEQEPIPLPNLDYKIMQGNSLLESFEGVDLSQIGSETAYETVYESNQMDLFTGEAKKKTQTSLNFEDIKTLMDDYFDADNSETKKALHDRIDQQVLNHIKFTIESKKAELAELKKNLEKNPRATVDKKIRKRLTQVGKELDECFEKEVRLSRIAKSIERPFFLWHLFFLEIFENGGFDIVIGNPPYVQLQKMGNEATILQEAGYETFIRTGDIYCLFYELGHRILKEHGVLTYITSNKWMRASYGQKLRQYFIEKCNPLKLIDFAGYPVFDNVTVDVNILVSEKGEFTKNTQTCLLDKSLKSLNYLSDYFRQRQIQSSNLSVKTGWVILSPTESKIKVKIEAIGKPLKEWSINISRGILTGFNEAFIIDEKIKNELITASSKNAEIIRPILKGRNIKKYKAEFDNLWIINTHNGLKAKNIKPIDVINNYPALFEYFKSFESRLVARQDKGDHWTNLRNCAYLEELDKEKIVWLELTDLPKFAYDNSGILIEATAFMMTGEHLKYLTAFLNSKLCEWYFDKITTSSGVGTNRWKKIYIEALPIPELSENEMASYESLVDEILIRKERGDEFTEIEQEIDRKVFKIFDLTTEEVETITKSIISD